MLCAVRDGVGCACLEAPELLQYPNLLFEVRDCTAGLSTVRPIAGFMVCA